MNQDPRIVVLVGTFPVFSQTFVIDQIDALCARGLKPQVVAMRRGTSGLIHERARSLAAEASYAEDRIPLSGLVGTALMRRCYPDRLLPGLLTDLLKPADLVICHFGHMGALAARALAGVDRPRIWTIFHGFDLSLHLRHVGEDAYDLLFERGKRFFAVSELWMRKLEELGCPSGRIELLRMGVDVDRIPFVVRSIDPGQPVRILSVCRLVEKKGIDFALRALHELGRLRPALRWSYEIAGDGPVRASLERLTHELGLESCVHFTGAISEEAVRAKLYECEIFLQPSVTADSGDMEGVPVSLMNAMAAGVPVLSTFHRGIPELISDGVEGLLAPERDYLSLARNICTLLDSPETASSLAQASRRKVVLEFNHDRIIDDFAEEIRRELTTEDQGGL
jgi:colanic acid/amylovoran biosynthesis glycosyltransferase